LICFFSGTKFEKSHFLHETLFIPSGRPTITSYSFRDFLYRAFKKCHPFVGWLDFGKVARYHLSMTAQSLSKFQRYRARKKASGLKEVRLWVRDTNTQEFKAEMARAEKEYRALPADPGLEEFMEEALADVLKDIPPL
jgi:Protein  of unknown function (DUF3018)